MRPIQQKLESDIARSGGDEAVFDRFRDGEPIADIMASFGVSTAMFYRWKKSGGESREAAYAAAKRDSADGLIVRAEAKLFDDTEIAPTSAEVNRAAQQARFLQWLAGKRNRADYGDDPLVAINAHVEVGELHLAALIHHGLAEPGQAEQIPEAEYVALVEDVDERSFDDDEFNEYPTIEAPEVTL